MQIALTTETNLGGVLRFQRDGHIQVMSAMTAAVRYNASTKFPRTLLTTHKKRRP